jgi:hypothetical protein
VVHAEGEEKRAGHGFEGSSEEWDGHGEFRLRVSSREPGIRSQKSTIKDPTLSQTAREGWGTQ